MYDKKKEKLRTTFFALIAICGILTSCALLAFAIIGVALAPDLGSEKYFANDDNYQTFNVQIVEVMFYDDAINIMVNHSNPDFNDSMIISDKNAALAYENGAKSILKENMIVTVKLAPRIIGGNWGHTLMGLSYGDKVILPFEEGRKNIVDDLTYKSEVTSRALIIAGVFLGVSATGLVTSIIVSRKKNVFGS